MSLVLNISRIYLPLSVRKSRLNDLFGAAANAFQCQAPQLKGYSFNGCLREFALFTTGNAERCLQNDTHKEVKERLYNNAYRMGRKLRKELRVRTPEEVMQASGVVYKALNIEFHGDEQGQINISKCFFSSFYSGDVCRIISGLDEGLMAGLSGGLKLEFTQRITEGYECCKAHLIPERNQA